MKPGPRLLLALLSSVLAAQDSGGKGPWSLNGGAILFMAPSAPGSGQQRTRALPVLGVEYEGRYFLGSSRATVGAGLGVHGVKNESCTWDLGLGFTEGRKEKRADSLAGMGDQGASGWLGTEFTWRLGPVSLGASAVHGLSSLDGNRMGLHLEDRFRLGDRWMAGLSLSAGFGDARNLARDFGVTPEQASRRQALAAAGDPRLRAGEGGIVHQPGGGLRDVEAGATLAYLPGRGRRIFSLVKFTRLMGGAAQSPLVRERDSLSGGVGFSIAF